MTLIKHPTLERQRALLGFEPRVGIVEGVRRVCGVHAAIPLQEARRLLDERYSFGRAQRLPTATESAE
jgi:hypothetical protein